MVQPPEVFQRIYQQHGHRCPMSTLGGRLGLAALSALDVEPGSDMTAVFENDTCAVDGIELTIGCLQSTGALRVEDTGSHALTVRTENGMSVRVTISESALATAWEYRTVDEQFNAGRGTLDAEELKVLHEKKETVLQNVLAKFWSLPDEKLLKVEML